MWCCKQNKNELKFMCFSNEMKKNSYMQTAKSFSVFTEINTMLLLAKQECCCK